MLNIINDIIDISKIEANLMETTGSTANINELIEYVYSFFKPEVVEKGLQLSVKIGLPTQEASVKTDHEKFSAVLINLVKNAIKYTNAGDIEFGYRLKTNSEPALLEFFVKDTGIGIAEDRQAAIFERFIQADIEDKSALQGAGLGLAISKAYIEMLGGEIWVESQKDVGSVFYFSIPYFSESKYEPIIEKANKAYRAENQIENLKILIVEDDETSDLLLTTMLKSSSREILHAKTGAEAINT